MREILFRGKRIDNGKWVYGFYGFKPNGAGVDENFVMEVTVNTSSDSVFTYFTDVLVIPETVGQYTGLDDKNGQKIFGGDIVMVNGDADDCGEVLWDEDDLCYEININGWLTRLGEYCSRELEVIGNVHDGVAEYDC